MKWKFLVFPRAKNIHMTQLLNHRSAISSTAIDSASNSTKRFFEFNVNAEIIRVWRCANKYTATAVERNGTEILQKGWIEKTYQQITLLGITITMAITIRIWTTLTASGEAAAAAMVTAAAIVITITTFCTTTPNYKPRDQNRKHQSFLFTATSNNKEQFSPVWLINEKQLNPNKLHIYMIRLLWKL